MKTQKTLRAMDEALFQLQCAREILATARHTETSAKAVAESMAAPLDTLFDCLESLQDKA